MISIDVNEWRYFIAEATSATAKKLDAAEGKIQKFAEDFTAFRNTLPAGAEIVGLEEEGAWAPQIVQFGIKSEKSSFVSGNDWMETLKKGVYQAGRDTEFFKAQESLVKRLYQLPHPEFVWTLGEGEEKQNHPSLGIVMKGVPDGLDEGSGAPRTIVTMTTAKALHFNGGWLFVVPVNPENGEYYHPPGSKEISAEDVSNQLEEQKIERLPEFPATRPFTKLCIYERVLKY